MTGDSIGVAVVGLGMAGRAHAQGYRLANAVFDPDLPQVRLVAVADAYEPFARDAARRYGYQRAETSWQAVAEAPDVDAVSVVVANSLHREVVTGLLAAGKHVLCEKPLAPTVEDAQAMVAAAEGSDRVAAVGFTFRRSPAITAIRQQIDAGGIGPVLHFDGHYWCDYGSSPQAPMSWRYQGPPGSGALADIGSHLVDVAEYLCGPLASVRGSVLSTYVADRPRATGVAVGHAATEVSTERDPVENEDVATFTATFASGATGTFSVSRVAHGLPNSLGFTVFGRGGAASFDLARPAELAVSDGSTPPATSGYRQVLIGPAHPYLTRGLPMDFPGVGHGVNDFFTFQARAFLDQVAGVERLPPCPPLRHGLHNLQILRAVVQAAGAPAQAVSVP